MNRLGHAWQKSFTERKYRIGVHVFFWIVYFSLFKTVAIVVDSSMEIERHITDIYSLINFLIGDPMLCLIYYLTIFTAYRTIVYKKRYDLGILLMIFCMAVYVNALYLSNHWAGILIKRAGYTIPPNSNTIMAYAVLGYWAFMTNKVLLVQLIFSFFIYMSIPIFCKFIRDQIRLQGKQTALEKQNLQLHMDFIKMQIHPHFLFNTLNNIYSLITHEETRKSAEMVSGLSSLLRYALYDGKSEFIPLGKEISMVRNYIELEEVRSDSIRLEVLLPERVPDFRMPPFLLLPLVENAFKHGVNNQLKDSCVKIEIKLEGGQLVLEVRNSFDPEYRRENAGGLGLANLKKRLDYYYDGLYSLETSEKDHVFNATLQLPLSCPKSLVSS